MPVFQYQYDLVKSSRAVLFDYCRALPNEHLVMEHPDFARGSIRNLLVHIANVYQFWIGARALGQIREFTLFEAVGNMDGVVTVYEDVDQMMQEFMKDVGAASMKEFSFERNGVGMTEPALKIFTHVITHEYHHKGQILSMSRHMGYTPVDTDIIR